MARILVLGGGVCGLAASMLLARDGHDVTVLERDPAPVPESIGEAWSGWERRGVMQFRGPHFLQARVARVLDAELPDVRDALVAAAAARVDPVERMPAAIADRAARPGDERLVALTARRPALEQVLAAAAEDEPRLTVRRGVDVVGLTTRARDGGLHVTGVQTREGAERETDLVVDAMGRSSQLPNWLRDAGAGRVHEDAEDCGFIYYTRFFRPTPGGSPPEPLTPALLTPIGSFSILTLPCDSDTWSVTLYVSSGDQPLKRLRHEDRWTAVVSACPRHAHWLDGEPISDVGAMAGVLDRYRRLSADGRPEVTGIALVADSWACTNPSVARGIALGLSHAARLRDVVRSHLDDPSAFAQEWDAVTEAEFTPWYRATVAVDRSRLAEVEAIRDGREPPAPADGPAAVRARFPLAAMRDPDVFRAFMEVVGCLTLPADVFARPGLAERVLELADPDDLPSPPGPTRAELLDLLA